MLRNPHFISSEIYFSYLCRILQFAYRRFDDDPAPHKSLRINRGNDVKLGHEDTEHPKDLTRWSRQLEAQLLVTVLLPKVLITDELLALFIPEAQVHGLDTGA